MKDQRELSTLQADMGKAPCRLLWECMARLEMLTEIGKNDPSLLKSGRALAGFLLTLDDAQSLLGAALELLPSNEPAPDYAGDFRSRPL